MFNLYTNENRIKEQMKIAGQQNPLWGGQYGHFLHSNRFKAFSIFFSYASLMLSFVIRALFFNNFNTLCINLYKIHPTIQIMDINIVFTTSQIKVFQDLTLVVE